MQPLDSFMQLEFNKQNALPMDQWLLPSRGEDAATYDERMHLLGNIVVPAGGFRFKLFSQLWIRQMACPENQNQSCPFPFVCAAI